MEEEVNWEGAVNARPVLGRVYRMGRSEWLTEDGWRQAHAQGIRTVIDLRNAEERSRRPTDPVVDRRALEGISIVNVPTEEAGHPGFEAVATPYLNHPRLYPANIEFFPERIVAVFRALAAARGSVVLHCSAGRDRTGLIVTMLLELAGRRDLIAGQYEASVRGINHWHRISPTRHPYERYQEEDELVPQIAERLKALGRFIDALAVEEFLLEHGLSAAELAAVKDKLRGG